MLGTLGGWFQINKDCYHLLDRGIKKERWFVQSTAWLFVWSRAFYKIWEGWLRSCVLLSVATFGYLRMNSEVKILTLVYVSISTGLLPPSLKPWAAHSGLWLQLHWVPLGPLCLHLHWAATTFLKPWVTHSGELEGVTSSDLDFPQRLVGR